MKNKFLLWMIIFLALMTLMQSLGANREAGEELIQGDLGMATNKVEYAHGKEIVLSIQNNTAAPLTLTQDCPDEPFDVFFYSNGEWIQKSAVDEVECAAGEEVTLTIEAGKKEKVSYKNWAYRVFDEIGRYQIRGTLEMDGEDRTFASNEFTVVERGFFGTIWMESIYRPILNSMIFLIEVNPAHSLGLAIILLTLIIRTILLVPSQRAMRSQKRMQKVQTEIEELKKKYKDNQEKLAMETIGLWKKHKVNPFGSCLLILIQFPILIALYFVVSNGLHPDKSGLLYPSVGDGFSYDMMQTHFLGILELTEINFFVLPLIVGGLQFIQMHLAMNKAKQRREKRKQEKGVNDKDLAKKVEGVQDMQSEMEMATHMMKYFMPVMIAFFTASVPAGVGLYWGTSTLYGIVQQVVVNRESTKEKDENEPVVRVIEKE